MKNKTFLYTSAEDLALRIEEYFKWIEGEYHLEQVEVKQSSKSTAPEKTEIKVWDCEPQPPTLTGLALYLGFASRQAFEKYENTGRYASHLKRARLRIESEYEKKLHYQSSTGAIFALKSLGWTDKSETKSGEILPADWILKIEIIENGPHLAGAEQEVKL
ncbi:terminase small subunit [Mucilaginibacter lacusdianchii]|uniref:terminase small subunit n=1 Tax=Mucilaginibacter lacusdianchii TaxID=2684211 RepID=UPI00131B6419|nr:terminase small subunit [Mucilaginibacter sp. JXJ CY 39]